MAVTEVSFVVDPDQAEEGDYISLADWEAAEVTNTLITDDERYTVICRCTGGTADTFLCTFTAGGAWVTDATHYIKVWSDPTESYRHDGKRYPSSGNIYRRETTQNLGLVNSSGAVAYLHVIGIAFQATATTSFNKACFYNAYAGATTSRIKLEQCIFRGVISANIGAIRGVNKTSSAAIDVSNCTFYNFKPSSGAGATPNTAFWDNGGTTSTILRVYNCTVVNCEEGFRGGFNTNTTIKNCIAQDCTDGFLGTWDSGTNNASDIASDAPGSNAQTGEVVFVSETAGSEDFHLDSTDTVARGNGIDLSGDAYPITVDIDNQTRSAWDIGADEFYAVSFSSIEVFYVPHAGL